MIMISVQKAVELISSHKKVAVVGLSPKEDRPSFRVGNFLLEQGYDVTPVNPGPHQEILGQKNVRKLSDIATGSVDWIDLFVHQARLVGMAEEIIRIAPKLVWCQIGVVDEEFNQLIEDAGVPLIANVCPKIELPKAK